MSAPAPLRDLADARSLLIGAAVAPQWLDEEPAYAATLAREFNCLVAENAMKFMYLEPERGRFEFAAADRLVAFARRHRMQVRGHTLAWHVQLPEWFKARTWSRSEALGILETHTAAVLGHYRGQVFAWDVVNEALADDGGWRRDSPWFQAIGEDYLEQAFRFAHAADPDALLFYNDYGMELSAAKADACCRLLAGLRARGVPVHGVGFQFHLGVENRLDPAALVANLRRFRDLGLAVHVTELDMGIPQPITDERRREQADEYASRIRICLEAGVAAVLFWGFTDRHSWIPASTKGQYAEALLFDREYRPKPAYSGVAAALAGTACSS
jgi:endo-1,4-beta-xylanase